MGFRYINWDTPEAKKIVESNLGHTEAARRLGVAMITVKKHRTANGWDKATAPAFAEGEDKPKRAKKKEEGDDMRRQDETPPELEKIGVKVVTNRERDGIGMVPGSHDSNGNPRFAERHEVEIDPAALKPGQIWHLDGIDYTLICYQDPTDDLPGRWRVEFMQDGKRLERDLAPGALRTASLVNPAMACAPKPLEVNLAVWRDLAQIGVSLRGLSEHVDALVGQLAQGEDVPEMCTLAAVATSAASNIAAGMKKIHREFMRMATTIIGDHHKAILSALVVVAADAAKGEMPDMEPRGPVTLREIRHTVTAAFGAMPDGVFVQQMKELSLAGYIEIMGSPPEFSAAITPAGLAFFVA